MQSKKVQKRNSKKSDSTWSIGSFSTTSELKVSSSSEQIAWSESHSAKSKVVESEDEENLEILEDDIILRVSSLPQIQAHEQKVLLRSQAFLRKYASTIKKSLLLNAINHKYAKDGIAKTIIQQDQGQDDRIYRDNQVSLLNIEPLEERENDSKQFLFPHVPLLNLESNPILSQYFSDNLQLLGWLERLGPQIIKDWKEQELVTPCFIKEQQQSDIFTSISYPQYCWHKSKRLLSLPKLEEQAELLMEVPQYSQESDKVYIMQALELLKVQKGIIKLRYLKGSAQQKSSSKAESSKFQVNEIVQYSKTCLCRDVKENKELEQDTPINSQNSSHQESPKQKRDKKSNKMLVCSYCDAAYHLKCMIEDNRWMLLDSQVAKQAIPQEGQKVLKKRGRKRKVQVPIEDLEKNVENQEEEKDISQIDKTNKMAMISPMPYMLDFQKLDDYKKSAEYLKKLGYLGKNEKWACKNCLMNFVADHLASQGDLNYLQAIDNCQFQIERIDKQ